MTTSGLRQSLVPRLVALGNTRAWLWSAVAVSIVIFPVLIVIHLQDQESRQNALTTIGNFREARIDLSQGLLHLALGGPPELPFDRAQGLALLQQALSAMNRSTPRVEPSDGDFADLRRTLAEVQPLIEEWNATGSLDSTAATRLRIAFHQLDRLADAVDISLRSRYQATSSRHAALFRVALGAAALVLIVLCGIILLVDQAREASLAGKRRGEAELRLWIDAVERAGLAMAISDAQSYRILFANTAFAAMRGMSVAEVIGCSFADLYPPEEHARVLRMFALSDAEGKASFESQCLRKEGGTFPVQVHFASVRDRDGSLCYRVATPVDITDLKRTQQELAIAQKMEAIGQLTGGIAHDFNNMLTVVTGTIEILADGVADRPRLAAIARLIEQAAARGADLTRQLLAFSRRQALEPRDTDVNALLDETIRLLKPTLGPRIAIENVLEPSLWPAMIDPGQLSNAVVNLAINARDAMPDGGRLLLTTSNIELDETDVFAKADWAPGRYVVLAVTDTGAGIPADIRDKVVEPFFTTKPVGRGTGLGLSMVYGFIKQSGGHIEIVSEEGHGTTIRLFLPRGRANPVSADAPAQETPQGSEIILVVEDDELVRNFVVAQLADLGYHTLVAADGPSALAIVDTGAQFDLLFTDIVMPGGMHGGQLAEEVRRRRPGTLVLLTSGYAESAALDPIRLPPGIPMLTKPYRKSDMAIKLREILDTAVTAAAG